MINLSSGTYYLFLLLTTPHVYLQAKSMIWYRTIGDTPSTAQYTPRSRFKEFAYLANNPASLDLFFRRFLATNLSTALSPPRLRSSSNLASNSSRFCSFRFKK